GSESRAPIKRQNLPQFAAAESVVLRLPNGVASGRLLGVFALNDTVLAIVSTEGIALANRNGSSLGSPAGMAGERPAYVARCTQGGLVIITQTSRKTVHLDPSGTAFVGVPLPTQLGTILG